MGTTLLLKLHDLAGTGIDIALILGSVGAELHLVEHQPVITVKLHLAPGHIAHRYSRPGCRGGEGGVLTDIRLIAGSAGLGYRVGGKIAGAGDQGDLIDGQRRQAFHRKGSILGHHFLDQSRLAHGNAVGLCQLSKLIGLRHCLTEDAGADAADAEAAADGVGDLRLELGGALGIGILHADQDGVLQVAEVAILEHGTNNGIHRHIEVGAGEIHVTQNHLGLLIEGIGPDHFLPGVDGQGNTGIHVQHDHGIHRAAGFPEIVAKHADAQGQGRCHSHQGSPAISLLLGIGSIVVNDLAHRYHISFLLIVGGKDTVEYVRRCVVHSVRDPLFQLLVAHIAIPPSLPRAASSVRGCTWTGRWAGVSAKDWRSPGASYRRRRGA